MNKPDTQKQLHQLYSLSHQELWELVKVVSFNAVAIYHDLKFGKPPEITQHVIESIDFAASFIPQAVAEAKEGWTPAPLQENPHN